MAGSDYDRFAAADGTSIAYWITGAGSPVILLHGYPVTSTTNFATHYDSNASAELTPSAGPTLESALVAAGFQVVRFDRRGCGRSDRPHGPERYSMAIFADDVRALVSHLGIGQAALVGYSFGAWICCYLLGDPWVTKVALTGVASSCVEGEYPELGQGLATLATCFRDNRWGDYPDYGLAKTWAELDDCGADFIALGAHALGNRAVPKDLLSSVPASLPLLVLNGGADDGADDAWDMSRLVPGARRVIAGSCHHGTAPGDPAFQAELVQFLSQDVPDHRL